jgi:hypothetical protein
LSHGFDSCSMMESAMVGATPSMRLTMKPAGQVTCHVTCQRVCHHT